MAFRANPLSLSVPETALETWLRDSGYLEVVDQPTTTTSSSSSSSSSSYSILLRVLTLNPFSKLSSDDFSGQTPPWTAAFIGSIESYSVPWSTEQARMRVQENVKRYARNYASLFVVFFASSLYQMPFALVGLVLCLALWDTFRFCGLRWGLDEYPLFRHILIRTTQCVTGVILICANVQMAFLCALAVSYTVMILHASFRKLASANQPNKRDGTKRK